MYEQFFGFAQRPFSLTPDPEFLYWTDQHRRAFDLVRMSLIRHAPIALVTGEVGAGKTTLIRKLLQELSDDLEVALLSNVVGDSGDLLRWILTSFGQDAEPSTRAEAVREVEAFLRRTWTEGRRTVLIVDEAQNVSDNGIETLRLLTNLDVGRVAPLSLVLAGQPQLRERLRGPQFGAFRQRLGGSFHLGPMTRAETTGYVRNRLKVAGGSPDIFEPGAIEAVHRRAMGIPRLTNLLCDVCLVSAYGEDRPLIDAAFAEAALAESLAVGGLGGLAAEAAQAEEAIAQGSAAARTAAVPLLKVSRGPTSTTRPGAVPPGAQRRSSAPPSLRLVTEEASTLPDEAAGEAPLPPLAPAEQQPLSPEGPSRDPAPDQAAPSRWLAVRPGSVSRRALGSVAGVAIAASLACAALILPAAWTDAGQAVSAVATLLSDDEDGTVASVESPRAVPVVTASAGAAGGVSDAAFRLPEARLAGIDQHGSELLFIEALDSAAMNPVAAAVGYSRAAARGHERAAYYLAQMYETGDGVVFAPDTAWAWYAVAADGVRGAEERLTELAVRPAPDDHFATPLFSGAADGAIELVWEGRGSFVVELAAIPDDSPEAVHSTPLTAVRLEAPQGVAWWRVRAVGEQPSDWLPVGPPAALWDEADLK